MAWYHRYRIGFKGWNQLPLVLFWIEYYERRWPYDVEFAKILWRLD